ncbi:MAG: hypothetical protein IPN03_00490 [Holophagales bacterium]|nr:hypothetical protein [Holophagales bacterium]
MPTDTLLPALDPMAIPGPPWLFHALWLVTFAIHVVGVNLVLGSSILGTMASLDSDRTFGRGVAGFFAEVNTWAVSLTITFGIAPLLFLQVLHGRLFYSATVILAPAWLGLLLFLTAAYYLTYGAKYRLRAGKGAAVHLGLSALLFLGVAAIQVVVHLLSVQPGRWEGVLAAPWTALSDRSFLPRFLHFVLAGVTLAGILLAWVSVRRVPEDGARAEASARAAFGVKIALLATLLQLVVGLWLTISVPREVLLGLMRGGGATMLPLTLGIAAGFGLLVFLARVRDPIADRTSVRRSLELFGLAMVLMLVTRHQLRDLYIAAAGADAAPATTGQWGVFAIFLGSFVLCAALAIVAVVRSAKDRPGPGEATA